MDFQNKTAVVTAGANGIGRCVCEELAQRGMTVVIADIDENAAIRAAAEIRTKGYSAVGVKCDVRFMEDVNLLRELTIAEFGAPSLLMNHAGISVRGQLEMVPLESWRDLLEVNVLGMVRILDVFLPDLKQLGSGHVVFTTSSLALISGHPQTRNSVPYVTTKAAVVGLAQSVAMYLEEYGIRVTLFAPDYTDTSFPKTGGLAFGAPMGVNESTIVDVPYPAQTPEHAANVLISALEDDAFLASATVGISELLQLQAISLMDPTAITPAYYEIR
jgi:NAD(P)-dependent dehydrogenase (short-subunit alcohol dehydrogenase family)